MIFSGGIVGQSNGSGNDMAIIKNCTNAGIVHSQLFGGGIAGTVSNTEIVNCANGGNVDGLYEGGIVCFIMEETSMVNNCVSVGKVSNGIAYMNLGTISNSYYLKDSASNATADGNSTGCGIFSANEKGEFIIDNDGKENLVTKLNEYVEEHKGEGYELWSSSNGSLMLGDYTVIETTPTPDTGVTTTAIAVAENSAAAQTLESENIKVYDGIYGGYEYGNSISTTFKTTQAISDIGYNYGVWTVDLSQGNSYVKSSTGTGTAVVEDGTNVNNNKGGIYATEKANRKNYTLYFNKSQTTVLSGEGGVVFGLVIDGLYAPDAAATFEFKETAPDGATELTKDNSIFKADGESYQHNDSVLHKNAS